MKGEINLTKEQRTEAINLSYEGMLKSQALIDHAQTEREKNLSCAMYEAFHCLYLAFVEDQRKQQRSENA